MKNLILGDEVKALVKVINEHNEKYKPLTKEEFQHLIIRNGMEFFIRETIKTYGIEHTNYRNYIRLRRRLLKVGKQFNKRLVRPTIFESEMEVVYALEYLYGEIKTKEDYSC